MATIIGVIKTDIDSSIRIVATVVITGMSLYALVRLYESLKRSYDTLVEKINSKDTSLAAMLVSSLAFVILTYVFLRMSSPIIGTFQSVSTTAITGGRKVFIQD